MKKVVLISRKSNQTDSFMTAVNLASEKGDFDFEVKLAIHPNHKALIEEFQPEFAIISPEMIVWQAEVEKYLKELNIPYITAKGSHYGTRQVAKIFELVK